MNITKYMKREASGLAVTTLELAKYEEILGNDVCIREPSDGSLQYSSPTLVGAEQQPDIYTIHSQMNLATYFDNKPKVLFCHGEPLSSVGNGISMKAMVDLAEKCDAFICMRKEEYPIWSSLKRTFVVPKGIDLDVYRPLEGSTRLPGEPAILYSENWRGQRNPLYLCVAMERVWKKYPKAALHLYNCTDPKMLETFKALSKHNKWWVFLRSIQGPVKGVEEVNKLYNQVDIVVSCLYPLYARSIEAFGAGKAFIGPGYREPGYPWTCELDPDSMADAIINAWEGYQKVNYRKWAEDHHDVRESAKQCLDVYKRYL